MSEHANSGNNPETKARTTVGNYFVSNYPPYSFWSPQQVPALEQRLARPPEGDPIFGLYVHLPFCRQRCEFCYYKVYTDKSAKEIKRYLAAVIREAELAAATPYLQGRKPRLLYFGGGTPSFLSVRQLEQLWEGLAGAFSLDSVEELTFECEPGTLQEAKIKRLQELGVTRLSLGVENFSPEILERNNRAHRAKEIHRAYDYARQCGFPQINIDLIAGMIGETEENWQDCIRQTIDMHAECVTIYQMEVPYNTVMYHRMQEEGKDSAPVADWETKRRWVDEAFTALETEGYSVSSVTTAVARDDIKFRYRDALFSGADLLGLGVASFGHLGGVHAQNEHSIGPYMQRVENDELPTLRAYALSDEERLIREFILTLKLGTLSIQRFRDRFGVDVTERFGGHLRELERQGHLSIDSERIVLARDGLLQIDRFLEGFYLEEHAGARYA